MAEPKDIIDAIRRKQYLIDVELSPDAEEGAQNIRETLNNTLKMLAEDLYSKETHFVLELVQNADDNEYPAGVTPEMSFELEEARLTVTNNEVGFAVPNVRALCNAGKSTKSKRDGYIGEKGIGFKSVFAVSDRPEIHSNGFHFRFDAAGRHALGYVVPEWLPGVAERLGTRIVLPAKDGRPFNVDLLEDLSAELLLFLRKLRRLAFTDLESGASLSAERCDRANHVTLTTRKTKDAFADEVVAEDSYLVARHAFSVADVKEERRPGITTTEIVLAFPLKPDGAALATLKPSVFAFLPVRTWGGSFVVQADFLLSSSREDIHRDWPWNVAIRNQIAAAFASALPLFKASERLAASFLELVPNPPDIADEFFRRAATQIVERLGNEACVLGTSGKWRKPSEILLASEALRELFSNDEVLLVLHKEYPSDALTSGARQVLLRLGARQATLEDVASLVSVGTLLNKRPASWFTALYRFLGSLTLQEAWLKRFRSIACIRTTGAVEKALKDGKIFFPLEGEKRYGFEDELRIVDPVVLAGSKDDARRAREFLERLGVKEAAPYLLIRDHILPRHAADEWKSSTAEARVGHVRYVKDHLHEFRQEHELIPGPGSAKDLLASGLYLQNKKPADQFTYYSRPSVLYLPAGYAPQMSLEDLLGDGVAPDAFVNELYVEGDAENDEPGESGKREAGEDSVRESWRSFFYAIGVNRLPTVASVPGGATVDYEAGPHLRQLLGSDDAKQISAAIRIIDRNWEYYRQYQFVSRHGVATGSPSAFIEALRQLPAPTRKQVRLALSETYVSSDMVRAVLGEALHYLAVNVTNTDFMDAVGITHQVDARACFKRLDQLHRLPRVRVGDVRHVYRALETRFAIEQVAVVVGMRAQRRAYVPATKTWYALSDVVWGSSGALLDSLYPPLEPGYWEHRTFFCDQLKVPKLPDEDALLAALGTLDDETRPLEERQKDALQIYRRLAAALALERDADSSVEPAWLLRLKKEALFLDHLGRLVHASNDLYVEDDARLAELFKPYRQISLLAVDRARIGMLQPLLEACRVPALTGSVRFQLQSVTDEEPEHELTRRIQQRAEAIRRYVFHRQHGVFERAMRAGSWSTLQHLEVVRVGGLTVETRLSAYTAEYSGETFRDGRTLYVQRDMRSVRDKVCQELCALLEARAELADVLFRILFAESEQGVEDFLEVKGVLAIPVDEIDPLNEETRGPPTVEENEGELVSADEMDGTPKSPVDERDPVDTAARSPAGLESDLSWLDLPETGRGGASDGSGPREGSHGLAGDASGATSGEGVADVGGYPRGTRPNRGVAEPSPRRHESRRTGRLLSYVEPHVADGHDDADAESKADDAARTAVAAAAVAFVMEQERTESQTVKEMPPGNEGFDILRRTAAGVEEYIEVKGQSGPWTELGVGLTPPEMRYAARFGERYFLYVVEFARDAERRQLYRIQDPYGKVMRFQFDSGWKGTATTLDLIEPAVGMEIEMPERGTGTIVNVHRHGQLFSLEVQIGEAAPVSLVFIPGAMRLRRK